MLQNVQGNPAIRKGSRNSVDCLWPNLTAGSDLSLVKLLDTYVFIAHMFLDKWGNL